MNPDWNEKLEQAILLPEIGSARANVPQSLGNSPEKSPEKMEDYQDSDIKLSALSDESASIPATESYLQGQSRRESLRESFREILKKISKGNPQGNP